MNKELTVSIGIPAYNEEQNIKILLERLLAQKIKGAILEEILIISDGSTDRTVEISRSFKSSLITVVERKDRLGQEVRQNEILQMFKGDILVILEADTLPQDELTISKLIEPLIASSGSVVMAVGEPASIQPKTFLEKILYHNALFKRQLFSEFKNGMNIYICGGHSMKALLRRTAAQIRWPIGVPEDAYIYLFLTSKNYRIVKSQAKAYMKNVDNFSDRLKQNKKFLGGKKALGQYFPAEYLQTEYCIPKPLILKQLFRQVMKHPVWTVLSLVETFLTRTLNLFVREFDSLYIPYMSSKKLISADE